MFIGFLLALVFFGTLSYFVTRGVISHAYQTGRPILGALFLFIALVGGLSLLSLAMMAAGSMLGLSVTLGLEALGRWFNAHPGLITAIGALVIGLLNLVTFFVGPTCAFFVAKVMGILSLVTGLCKLDEKLAVTWLPVVAAVTATWFMWPFTACLTLGL
jgi:hypothetical protein